MDTDRKQQVLKAFGARLRELRTEAGISQSELADAMVEKGVQFHQQTVQKIEAGARAARADEIAVLAEVLEVEEGGFFWEPESIYFSKTTGEIDEMVQQLKKILVDLPHLQWGLALSVEGTEFAAMCKPYLEPLLKILSRASVEEAERYKAEVERKSIVSEKYPQLAPPSFDLSEDAIPLVPRREAGELERYLIEERAKWYIGYDGELSDAESDSAS